MQYVRLGATGLEVALAWLLSKPGVTAPIAGASKLSHLDDAIAALNVRLEPDDIALLEDPCVPHRILGHR
jgi:aryl-alcohol dehydrogenase-like predicted oxidoreductase